MDECKWFLRTRDETFGPETEARLVEWAKVGRIQPGQEISDDETIWRRVEDVPFLDMRFSIDIGDGNPRGPFNRAAAESLIASGRLPKGSRVVEVRAPFAPAPDAADAADAAGAGGLEVARARTPAPRCETPAPRCETPAPRCEAGHGCGEGDSPSRRVESAPVVKVVEKVVEKIVVDESRVKELESLLAEERRHTTDLQQRLDVASKKASDASLAAANREAELRTLQAASAARAAEFEKAEAEAKALAAENAVRIATLEEDLRRLPQAASEVADIQAAMYGIMTGEADEIAHLMEVEKREYEEARVRYQKRADRLLEHRQQILKRAGASVEEMTRKALLNRPEDPRTAQLRKEHDDLRRQHERQMAEAERKIRELTDQLRVQKTEELRLTASEHDFTQLRQETEHLRELLQRTEKDLLSERQRNEELVRQQETRQQALMARLKTLESPCIGTVQTLETNQSREAKQVKLPSWMKLKR